MDESRKALNQESADADYWNKSPGGVHIGENSRETRKPLNTKKAHRGRLCKVN
jgi:hypothetical protein